jgi:choline kinase
MSRIKANSRPVKTVILSAGQGRRLRSLIKDIPKRLIRVAGKSILERQFDALLAYGIDDITVVTGFKSKLVETVLQQRYRRVHDVTRTPPTQLANVIFGQNKTRCLVQTGKKRNCTVPLEGWKDDTNLSV